MHASVHSLWKTFEVFRFLASFALEKGHVLLRFFFIDISTTNKAITLERLISGDAKQNMLRFYHVIFNGTLVDHEKLLTASN